GRARPRQRGRRGRPRPSGRAFGAWARSFSLSILRCLKPQFVPGRSARCPLFGRSFHYMDTTVTADGPSGVGVLDKLMEILDAVESGAGTPSELVRATGMKRPTLVRMTKALEQHGLLGRADGRRWRLGPRLVSLGTAAVSGGSYVEAIREAARPALTRLS